MARLLRMEHPNIKDNTAPTTMAAFTRTWKDKGWKLVNEKAARKEDEAERAAEKEAADKAEAKATGEKK